jgi:hypothetical protein
MEYVILILVFLIIALCYAIYNLLSQVEKYEDFIEADQERNEALLETLKLIDEKQMFEKDDEVGSLFIQIKETIKSFKEFSKNA